MQNKEIIYITKKILINSEIICEYIHRQNYYYASKFINETIKLLGQFVDVGRKLIAAEFISELVSVFKEISLTQETNNYVLLSDILQFKLVPMMGELQKSLLADTEIEADEECFVGNVECLENKLKSEVIANRTTSEHNKCFVEYTNVGALTLCVQKGESNIYFHSNGDPYKEARVFAAEYADVDYTDYVIFGMGLGYHVIGLLEYDPRYTVVVLENNIDILTLAFMYNDFSKYLSSKRLMIRYVKNVENITDYISSENKKLIIHHPSLVVLDESPYKSALKDYFMSISSIQAHIKELDANFWFNRKLGDLSIDVIKAEFLNRTVIYAGGGPSVQNRLSEIMEVWQKENAILVCAGTVYLKLLKAGIVPDYVIITDPLPSLVKQIESSEKTGTAMLYLSTASKEAVEAFEGQRYVVYQRDYGKSEEIAKMNGYTLFDTGGSVSTIAVDIALRLGCKKLVCVGLDLAFSDNQRHAFGIGGDVSTDANLLSVEAVDGGMVNTSNNLNMYRKWIENRIADVRDVELVNMSRGAKIHGMMDV